MILQESENRYCDINVHVPTYRLVISLNGGGINKTRTCYIIYLHIIIKNNKHITAIFCNADDTFILKVRVKVYVSITDEMTVSARHLLKFNRIYYIVIKDNIIVIILMLLFELQLE